MTNCDCGSFFVNFGFWDHQNINRRFNLGVYIDMTYNAFKWVLIFKLLKPNNNFTRTRIVNRSIWWFKIFKISIMYYFQRQRIFIQVFWGASELPNLVKKNQSKPLPSSIVYKYNSFLLEWLSLILSFSIHFISNLESC